MQLRFHTQTAGSTLTAQQPSNNIVRVALQAMAAVLGGTQSLHCNAMDEALALPTEDTARLALRTQQIIAAETGVANIVDPLGGSWAVEARTAELEAEARALMTALDRMGGMLEAIQQGWVQARIQDAAYAAQRETDSGGRQVVGLNVHTTSERVPVPTLTIDPAIEREQRDRVQHLKRHRDADAAARAIARVSEAARSGDNLVRPIIDAAHARATLGEIADALRLVFGEHAR